MTFEEWKNKEYPNGCIIPIKYGNGAEISQFLKNAFEAGQKSAYKYPKCIDCVHAHISKDGNYDCGFMDCTSEEDKIYSDDKAFEKYATEKAFSMKLGRKIKVKEIDA